ncbi:MAG: hypothetical protein IPJ19_08335 [Planctomycetes bacterium]|nr:hypothetical protein [Planctomycetota bacterium]
MKKPLLIGLAAGLALASSAASLVALRSWWPALEALLGSGAARRLLAVEFAAPLVCLAALALFVRVRPVVGGVALVRVLLCGIGLAWCAFLVCSPSYRRLWLELAYGPAVACAALALVFELWSARWRPRPAKFARAGLVALALTPLACEGALRVLASVRPSPLLVRDERAPGRVLERNRKIYSVARFGMACNSGGHFDEEFKRREAGEVRVALFGDSFSQGIVPYSMHYSTVAERALGFPVDNYGIAGVGPLEYEQLLLREALPLDPSAVVVAFFVGNDFEVPPDEPVADPRLSSWLDREHVLLWLVPRRLARLLRERRENPTGVAGEQLDRQSLDPKVDLATRYPWLFDPLQEKASISKAGYLAIERARVVEACESEERTLMPAIRTLVRMREECAPRPFGVLVIPDEFQVEDALWADVGRAGVARDRPQQVLARELGAAGIPVLDVLPVLRGVAPLADGNRHLYHLRDTHWNPRGNRVVGEALAPFLRSLLEGAR